MTTTPNTAKPASCKILTICTSIDHGNRLVQRLISFATHIDQPPVEQGVGIVPWTISNKYYNADVHFEIVQLKEWSSKQAEGVPAVLFVWQRGESYKDHILQLSKDLSSHDPDVALAIQMETSHPLNEASEEGVEEFFSTNGFEYIDGSNQTGQRALEDEGDSGTPGLARVVDALSTIMWPSMSQTTAITNRKSRARELLDWAREEEADDGLRSLLQSENDADDSVPGPSKRKSRMQKEMDEFQRWLEEDENQRAHQDPWARRDEQGAPFAESLSTPTAPSFNFEHQPNGFEDDFNEFVGAPVGVESPLEANRLVPMHTGASYMSLASENPGDLSRNDFEPLEDEKDDLELPSHEEVEETSQRIFGNTFPPSFSSSSSDAGQDGDDELSAFDLSRVFSALQVMKEEIAGIGDDEARRKAAARVALGLVYGLQPDRSAVDSEGEDA